jgi:hypothetical protein
MVRDVCLVFGEVIGGGHVEAGASRRITNKLMDVVGQSHSKVVLDGRRETNTCLLCR